ncbi:hypothetical protein [Psychrobacillus vulpis]|uniref:Uncharacterized protein n=1 Tax=Psychrobacillus vulpis TaxID=2325572 RepID=A0A544TRX4_9BACI|nr:hypothetical protein [Psychrobacillus vulpis]TQR20199.1 hypothetical protein FG384_08535 [Psychrobacillus vulpis]
MGYIIPVQPIQSQNYANRMLMDDYNFAYINNVNGIRMKSNFDKHLEQQEQKFEKSQEKQLLDSKEPSILPLFKSFIQPNPVNLSPKVAEISRKGNIINLYI